VSVKVQTGQMLTVVRNVLRRMNEDLAGMAERGELADMEDTSAVAEEVHILEALIARLEFEQKHRDRFYTLSAEILIEERERARGRRLEGAELQAAKDELRHDPTVAQVLEGIPGSDISEVRERETA
jgi:hypothetical protein